MTAKKKNARIAALPKKALSGKKASSVKGGVKAGAKFRGWA
jgi:hypothetical protein